MGLDALVTSFEFYFEDNRPIPLPSEIEEGADFVEVPLSVAAKVLLLNTFLEKRITQRELASRIGKPKQEIQRIFDLHHATKIDSLQAAAQALGKSLSISMD